MSPLLRLALPALAAAGTAYAASSCSTSATATVESGGDATAIAGCTTYTGSIAIATGVGSDVSFTGLKEVTGNFVVDSNSVIQRVGGSDLKKIGGSLKITNDSQLASLSLPKLTEADSITLNGLANLRELGFDAQVTKCSKLDIQNTQLQDLNGINLEEAESIIIANNGAVANISMKLTNVTSFLTLSYNNADVDVSFPNLESANNITFRACGSISIPALSQLNKGSLGIYESNIEIISAPNLTKIDAGLTINQNKNLKNISFPSLTTVGGNLQIANDTNLHTIDGFPKLKEVGAALDMSGDLTNVSTPSLNFVKGVFNLQSTADLGTVCADFYDPLRDKGKLPKTQYVCKGKLKEAGTAGTNPGSGSSSNKTGAAIPLSVQYTPLGLAGLLAVLLA